MRIKLAALMLLTFAIPAFGAPSRMPTGDPFDKGSAHNLPLGCGLAEETLVAAARNLPAVQVAIDNFAERGYIAIPMADTALSCYFGQPISVVTLAYSRPGLFLSDSTKAAAPLILITTQVIEGVPVTTVSAGVMVIDGETNSIYEAGVVSPSDGSFTVRRVSGGGGKSRYPSTDGGFSDFMDPQSQFSRWVRCTGGGAMGCVIGIMIQGGYVGSRLKFAILCAQPELFAMMLGGCLAGAGVTCIWTS